MNIYASKKAYKPAKNAHAPHIFKRAQNFVQLTEKQLKNKPTCDIMSAYSATEKEREIFKWQKKCANCAAMPTTVTV